MLAEHTGCTVRVISALDDASCLALTDELYGLVLKEREKAESAFPVDLPIIRPESRERFNVAKLDEGRFMVEGHRVVTFVEMMDTDMEGSRAEVFRRLDRWGVTKGLRRAGAREGDRVVFGEVELAWEI